MRLSTDHKQYSIVMLYLINDNKHSNRPSNCLQLLKCQKKRFASNIYSFDILSWQLIANFANTT